MSVRITVSTVTTIQKTPNIPLTFLSILPLSILTDNNVINEFLAAKQTSYVNLVMYQLIRGCILPMYFFAIVKIEKYVMSPVTEVSRKSLSESVFYFIRREKKSTQ